jgi:TetR/AcrR family transcriptional regulator, cholesterol catabolism regulator
MSTPPDQRSDQIRRVAAELFFDHGFEATTTRAIAQALGIKSASIYYHYEDKQEILFEIIYSTMRELIDRVRVGTEQQTAPDRKLATLIIHHVLMHAQWPKEAILGDTELRSLTGERRKVVQRLRDEYERLLTDILAEGREARAFELLDEKLTAYAILAQCTHVGTWYERRGRLTLTEVAFDYVAFGLRLAGAASIANDEFESLMSSAQTFYEDARGRRVAT